MTLTQEKVFFGVTTYLGSGLCSMGAIVNSGELRWIYVTLAVGVMTSAFLALLFKKATDTIQIVVGWCGLSIMMSMVDSKVVVHFYNTKSPGRKMMFCCYQASPWASASPVTSSVTDFSRPSTATPRKRVGECWKSS